MGEQCYLFLNNFETEHFRDLLLKKWSQKQSLTVTTYLVKNRDWKMSVKGVIFSLVACHLPTTTIRLYFIGDILLSILNTNKFCWRAVLGDYFHKPRSSYLNRQKKGEKVTEIFSLPYQFFLVLFIFSIGTRSAIALIFFLLSEQTL